MSKIKEKKLNSIKSDMEEIKKFIVSNNDLNSSDQNKTDYLNNKSGAFGKLYKYYLIAILILMGISHYYLVLFNE